MLFNKTQSNFYSSAILELCCYIICQIKISQGCEPRAQTQTGVVEMCQLIAIVASKTESDICGKIVQAVSPKGILEDG